MACLPSTLQGTGTEVHSPVLRKRKKKQIMTELESLKSRSFISNSYSKDCGRFQLQETWAHATLSEATEKCNLHQAPSCTHHTQTVRHHTISCNRILTSPYFEDAKTGSWRRWRVCESWKAPMLWTNTYLCNRYISIQGFKFSLRVTLKLTMNSNFGI